ncbi:ATP-binding cassette domain-containing protein [Haliangium sp.]|uniref:ABC transporter ATP-binding protein n=1 Tax=Haliangium sp. TaxID=2663208 RepID=UPI003D12CE3F
MDDATHASATPAASDPSVLARGLVKRYGDLVAVDGIDLEAHPGTCLGVLGPNGAGKTTTIEMLEGIRAPDEGEVSILGRRWHRHARSIRARIGVQLQETQLEDKLSVRETLRLYRSFYKNGRTVDEVIAMIGLEDKHDAWVVKLSGGQKQRLTLGCALVNRPAVLFLDEPTTGLDPQARRRVWDIVEAFKQDGGTVILTTHYMEEADRLSDQLVIFDRGRIIARGTPASLIESLGVQSIVSVRGEALDQAAETRLRALPGVRGLRRDGGAVVLEVDDTRQVIAGLFELDLAIEDLHTHRPTLDDVFMALTGRELRDD